MITQNKFDAAYHRISEMHEKAVAERRSLKDQPEREGDYHGQHCREVAFSQALSVLENADREAVTG